MRLRRQNLTALGTAAGENLAAVGSSHSLTETVHLGSVATAGLIGTLHVCTPPVKFTYARQPIGCSGTYLPTIDIVMLAHYNAKSPQGQDIFLRGSNSDLSSCCILKIYRFPALGRKAVVLAASLQEEENVIPQKRRCAPGEVLEGVALIAGAINSTTPPSRIFGYFLGGTRKYRPRQGPKPMG